MLFVISEIGFYTIYIIYRQFYYIYTQFYYKFLVFTYIWWLVRVTLVVDWLFLHQNVHGVVVLFAGGGDT